MKNLFAAAALLSMTVMVHAHETQIGALTIHHPYSLETAKSARAGAGYMKITNAGDTADKLVGVKADFPMVMIHDTEVKDGVARMFHVEEIEIPAGGEVELAPKGKHIMFMGLDGDPFETGETVPATLVFENAGEVDVEFKVEARN